MKGSVVEDLVELCILKQYNKFDRKNERGSICGMLSRSKFIKYRVVSCPTRNFLGVKSEVYVFLCP